MGKVHMAMARAGKTRNQTKWDVSKKARDPSKEAKSKTTKEVGEPQFCSY